MSKRLECKRSRDACMSYLLWSLPSNWPPNYVHKQYRVFHGSSRICRNLVLDQYLVDWAINYRTHRSTQLIAQPKHTRALARKNSRYATRSKLSEQTIFLLFWLNYLGRCCGRRLSPTPVRTCYPPRRVPTWGRGLDMSEGLSEGLG